MDTERKLHTGGSWLHHKRDQLGRRLRQWNAQLPELLHRRITRLTLSYLAIMMAMSLGFSFVLYHTSAYELRRQIPPLSFHDPDTDLTINYNGTILPPGPGQRTQDFLRQRAAEGRGDILGKLVLMNIGVLMAGSVCSYYLAQRTLRPIERAIEAQSRFASDASHELRTPLAVIQTENEVALRRPHLSVAEAKQVLASNIEEVIKLRSLAEGLLRLAREEPADSKLEAVSLPDVAVDSMNHVLKVAQAKDIAIDDTVPRLQVLADKQGLTQAAVILLDNAIKYSPRGTTIHMTAIQRGKAGLLQVRDEGPGIPADDLPRIFDRFYRADQSRSKANVEGHGLGLSLAQKIVHGLGGRISARSTEGAGATFTIRLPLA